MTKWMAFPKNKPERDVQVLGNMFDGFYNTPVLVEWDGKLWIDCQGDEIGTDDEDGAVITHWQPIVLPAAPATDTEE